MKHLLLILLPLVAACGCSKEDGTYAVGDVYSHNGKTGIVVYVSDNGLHGRIVSTDETEDYVWSVESVVVGADDENDGMNNMKKVQAIEGWREKYPAFAWCADHGKDWYLPSMNELKMVNSAKIVVVRDRYWSSTEYAKQPDKSVNTFRLVYGNEYSTYKNTAYVRTRAMAKF